jgi:hypothetical protein
MLQRAIYGAIFFDDVNNPKSGWASVRGESAFRITSPGTLDSSIFWWSNLDLRGMDESIGNPKIKKINYLAPNMDQLIGELGLGRGRTKASTTVQIVSEIFDRVMRLAHQQYGLQYPVGADLAEDLFDHIIIKDKSITPEIDEALRQSYQTWAKTAERKTKSGEKWVTFRRPRMRHAQDVLATPIPGDEWEFIAGNRLPAEKKRVDWLLAQPQPALVQASVSNIQFEYARVLSFGAGYLEGDYRGWMSHPELLMFSKFAKVKVENVFLASEYAPQLVYRQMNDGGTLGLLSISNGILADNYWIALATARTFKKYSQKNDKIFSPRAVWLSASDRFYSVLPALMMDGSGFTVRGYGRGKVVISIDPGAIKDVRDCASAAGLTCPLNVQDSITVQTHLAS